MIEEIIVVPGNPDESYTCITSTTREHPWTAWNRAASHCIHFLDVGWFERRASQLTCLNVVRALTMEKRPPRRAVELTIRWGWMNCPASLDFRRKW